MNLNDIRVLPGKSTSCCHMIFTRMINNRSTDKKGKKNSSIFFSHMLGIVDLPRNKINSFIILCVSGVTQE